jgi:hypothetical protein
MRTKNNFQNVGTDEDTLRDLYCDGNDPMQECPFTDIDGIDKCITCCTENMEKYCENGTNLASLNCDDLCHQHNKPDHPVGNGCCRFDPSDGGGCEWMGTCNGDECKNGFKCYKDCDKCLSANPNPNPNPNPHPNPHPPTPYSGSYPWSDSDKQKFMNGFPIKISSNVKLCILKNLEEKYSYEQFNNLDVENQENREFMKKILNECTKNSDYDGKYIRGGNGGGGNGGGGNYGNAPPPYSGPGKWSDKDEKKFIDDFTSTDSSINSNIVLCMLKNLEEKYSYEQFNNLDQTNKDNIEFMDKLLFNCGVSSDYDGLYKRDGSGTGKHIVLIIGIIIGSLLLAAIVAFLVLKKK